MAKWLWLGVMNLDTVHTGVLRDQTTLQKPRSGQWITGFSILHAGIIATQCHGTDISRSGYRPQTPYTGSRPQSAEPGYLSLTFGDGT
jgi:hypothetical protein